MRRVVVVGSANMDLVVRTPALPRPGETVLGGDFVTVPGGKGANQAVAVARAGAECVFIGAVGDDEFGERLRAGLADAGVDVSRVRRVPGPSGVALIAVDAAGENSIVVAPGANAALDGLEPADIAAIAGADVLLCQLEVPLKAVLAATRAAQRGNTFVVLNAAPVRPLPAELLSTVDLLVVNKQEADSLGDLWELVPRAVVTLGADGAEYTDRDGQRLHVPAPRVEVVNTTGAGDAFTGTLAVAWANHLPVATALKAACEAGARAAASATTQG